MNTTKEKEPVIIKSSEVKNVSLLTREMAKEYAYILFCIIGSQRDILLQEEPKITRVKVGDSGRYNQYTCVALRDFCMDINGVKPRFFNEGAFNYLNVLPVLEMKKKGHVGEEFRLEDGLVFVYFSPYLAISKYAYKRVSYIHPNRHRELSECLSKGKPIPVKFEDSWAYEVLTDWWTTVSPDSCEIEIEGVSLLSTKEAKEYKELIKKYIDNRRDLWLREESPANDGAVAVLYVDTDDIVKEFPRSHHYIHPVLKVRNLKELDVHPGDRLYIFRMWWVALSSDQLISQTEIGYGCFDVGKIKRTDFVTSDYCRRDDEGLTNDYEKSVLKEWLENWFDRQ